MDKLFPLSELLRCPEKSEEACRRALAHAPDEATQGQKSWDWDAALPRQGTVCALWAIQGSNNGRPELSVCPGVKNIGKPCAGKPLARFDEGGQAKACSLLYPIRYGPAPALRYRLSLEFSISANRRMSTRSSASRSSRLVSWSLHWRRNKDNGRGSNWCYTCVIEKCEKMSSPLSLLCCHESIRLRCFRQIGCTQAQGDDRAGSGRC